MRRARSLLLLATLLLTGACGDETATPEVPAPQAFKPNATAKKSAEGEPGMLGGFPRDLYYFERDLFPSLDSPAVISADRASWLRETDEVLGVVIDGVARAYPVAVLQYVHAVNDRFGKQNVLVTWCSICSSGTCFTPRFEDRLLTFGFEGIVHGMSLLYDRQTRSRWFHINGECFDGVLEGHVLKPVGLSQATTFGAWKARYPKTEVLDIPDELPEEYMPNGQWVSGSGFMPEMMSRTIGVSDPRLAPDTLVLGVVHERQAMAFPFQILEGTGRAATAKLGKDDVLVLFDPEVRAPGAFLARFEGALLSLERTARGVFEDKQRGIRVDLGGRLLGPSAKGRSLVRIPCVQAEWYGWSGMFPDTRIWRP